MQVLEDYLFKIKCQESLMSDIADYLLTPFIDKLILPLT